ncbi:MAG: NAD(P)H:quinone oxidoreductase [Spirochaetaceae bacterium]
MKVLIVFYSMYGHIQTMAEAVAEGARAVSGTEVEIKRVPETLSGDIIEAMGAADAQKAIAQKYDEVTHADLEAADAIIIGTPTRFGNMIGQMREFLDSTGPLWARGALTGKVGSVFTSTQTQHGGQEITILTTHVTLFHLGLVLVGLPYDKFPGQMTMDEITGGSPYGATTLAGEDGSRMPSENELEGARIQGRHVAEIASKIAGKA